MDPKSDDRGEQKEFSNPQDVVFVNTQLILKAMQNVQKAQQDFQAMLEQAELGDTSVQYDLGVRYAEGDGVDSDMVQAAHWFSLAAESGDLRAIEALGRCYQMGTGVEEDQGRAVELYTQAADQGYAGAQCSLGLCLENGSGVDQDPVKAAEYYLLAAE